MRYVSREWRFEREEGAFDGLAALLIDLCGSHYQQEALADEVRFR